MARGRIVLDAAMAWRRWRKPGAFTDLCRVIDAFLHEDREAERQRYLKPPAHLTGKRGRI